MPSPKHLSQDGRIRSIFQKHVAALSREIAQELTQPLLEHWGLTHEALSDALSAAKPVTEPVAEPVAPKALLFDRKTSQWVCPRCGQFSDLRRRAVTTHLRFCTAPIEDRRIDLRALNAHLRAANHSSKVRPRRPGKKKP